MWMKPPVRLDLCGVAGSVDVRAAKVASVSMPSLGTDGSDDDDLCSVTLQSAQGDDVVKARLLVGAAVVAVPQRSCKVVVVTRRAIACPLLGIMRC